MLYSPTLAGLDTKVDFTVKQLAPCLLGFFCSTFPVNCKILFKWQYAASNTNVCLLVKASHECEPFYTE